MNDPILVLGEMPSVYIVRSFFTKLCFCVPHSSDAPLQFMPAPDNVVFQSNYSAILLHLVVSAYPPQLFANILSIFLPLSK